MKAISLWQPWASAMELGLKQNETRAWPTSYRGDLVICSSKRKMTQDDQETYNILVKPVPPNSIYQVLYGYALCVVRLYDCVPSQCFHGATPMKCSEHEASLGDYSLGRWIWLTDCRRRLRNPIPITGRQGLFNLSPELERDIRNQL